MKNFLRKLFYWDAPAQGAFFALTLWAVGYYLLFSVVFVLWTNGVFGWVWLPMWEDCISPGRWIVGFFLLLFPLYYLLLTLHFYYTVRQDWRRYAISAGFPVWVGLLIAGYGVFSKLSLLQAGSLLIAYFLILLPLVLAGKQWKLVLAALAVWGCGLFMLYLPWDYLRPILESHATNSPAGPNRISFAIRNFFGISGWGWALWFAIALLCRLGWYLLTAKLFAAWQGLKFRAMFGKGVLTLWGLAILTYLTFLVMVFFARGEAGWQIAELEHRFGRPVTVEALEKRYYGDERPDKTFWDNINQLAQACDIPRDYLDIYFNARCIVSAEGFEAWRKSFGQYEPVLQQWEKAFDGNIPPIPYEFTPGEMQQLVLPEYSKIRDFLRMEQWQIRFALADGRTESAMRAYDRMKNVTRILLREPSLCGSLMWLSCQDRMMDSIETMLESEQLSDSQLEKIAAELEQAEHAFSLLQENALYSDAVGMLDIFTALGNGTREQFEKDNVQWDTLPLRPFRLFFPQLWWYALLDRAAMAKNYNAPDFRHVPNPALIDGKCLYLSSMLMPGFSSAGNRIDAVTVRLRAMRALIAAELYYRKYGNYPESLPEMPIDPFTGQPLHYGQGPYSDSQVFSPVDPCPTPQPPTDLDEEDIEMFPPSGSMASPAVREITVPAVMVWSPGPDGVESKNPQKSGRDDDIRAVRRLKQQKYSLKMLFRQGKKSGYQIGETVTLFLKNLN